MIKNIINPVIWFLKSVLLAVGIPLLFVTGTLQGQVNEIDSAKIYPYTMGNKAVFPEVQINMMDGEWINPRNTGTNGISNYEVESVFVDSRDRLFLNTKKYLISIIDIFDGNSWSYLNVGDDIGKKYGISIKGIVEDINGNYWLMDPENLYKYDSQMKYKSTLKWASSDTISKRLAEIEVDSDNRLWRAHKTLYIREHMEKKLYKIGGLSVYDIQADSIVFRSDTLKNELYKMFAFNRVRDFMQDVQGNMWVGLGDSDSADGGIIVFSSGLDSIRIFQKSNSNLPTNNIKNFALDKEGNLWTCFYNTGSNPVTGAAKYDGDSWSSFTQLNSPIIESCKSIGVGPDNKVYYNSKDTTLVYEDNQWKTLLLKVDGHNLIDIQSFASDFKGSPVFLKDPREFSSAVFLNKGTKWEMLSTTNDGGLFSTFVSGITTDTEGNLWATGWHGAGKFDGNSWTYFNYLDGLADNYSWTVHGASDGTVWFGTNKKGVTRFVNDKFEVISDYGIFQETIYEDSEGNIWLGSYNGDGILFYDGNEFVHYSTSHAGIDRFVTSITEDADGNIITAGKDRLGKFNGKTWSEWIPDSARNINAREIAFDYKNELWIANKDSLLKWDGNHVSAFAYPDSLSFNIYHISPDRHGKIWLNTTIGTLVFDNGIWRQANNVFSLITHHDRHGNTWVGTIYHGIFKFDTEHITSVEQVVGTPSNINLDQNYPNPFNPTTQIGFTLSTASQVQLSVYDLLGRRVATLLEGKRRAGTHQVLFNAKNLSSGVYIYRLKTEGFTQSRKMLLVK